METPSMSAGDAIHLRGVHKSFKRRTVRAEYTSFKSELVRWLRGKRAAQPLQRIEALRGIDLRIERGKTVGILGRNGSGKSTLLKLVTGIYAPTEGAVEVNGRISALLDLGAGFHPDFSGRENILINGIILGMSRAEVRARMEDIIAFSELGEFIDEPVRTYSSGMYMRLAFAVATHVDPDILIVDEILAVGDEHFGKKSRAKMESFKREGKTIVLVSHDLATVERWCDEAIWLDGGRIRAQGEPKRLVAEYRAAVLAAETSGKVMTPAALSADGGALPEVPTAEAGTSPGPSDAATAPPAPQTAAPGPVAGAPPERSAAKLQRSDEEIAWPVERSSSGPNALGMPAGLVFTDEFEVPEQSVSTQALPPAPRLVSLSLSAMTAPDGAHGYCREGESLSVRVAWSVPEPLPAASLRVELRTALAGRLVAVSHERVGGRVFQDPLSTTGAVQVTFGAMAVRPGSYRIEAQLRPTATVDMGPRLSAALEVLPAGLGGALLPLTTRWTVEGTADVAVSEEAADLIAALEDVGS